MFSTTIAPNTSQHYNNRSTLAPQLSCGVKENATAKNISYAVFLMLIMLTSIVGNVFVVLAVGMSRALKRRVTFYFIVSLACSDLLLGFFEIPFKISVTLNGDQFCHHVNACFFYIIVNSLGNVASILNLLLVAVDRFVAIIQPFRYSRMFSARNSRRAIFGVWMFSTGWSITGIFQWDRGGKIFGVFINRACINENKYYYVTSLSGIYLLVLVCITCSYIAILHTALKQIKAIEAMQVSVPSTQRHLLPLEASESDHKKKRRILRKEIKATKSVAIVYFAYVVCWLPCYVITIITQVDMNHFTDMQRNEPNLFIFLYYAFIAILPSINTMVNPFIYGFSNAQFRAAFKIFISEIFRIDMDVRQEKLHGVSLSVKSPNAMSPPTGIVSQVKDSVTM